LSALPNPFEGVPRSELEHEVRVLRTTVASVVRERDGYLANLTAVQGRCTELLTVDRVMKELRPLAERIVHARRSTPRAPTGSLSDGRWRKQKRRSGAATTRGTRTSCLMWRRSRSASS